MFKKVTASVLVMALLLTGCWDRIELNDRAIVLGWGMDLLEDGKYLATANYVLPTSPGGSGTAGGAGGGSGQASYFTESAIGINNTDAGQNMQHKLSRLIFAGHRRNIFIGEKLARAGVGPILDEYARSLSIRPRTNVFVVKGGTAQSVMTISYQLEKNPSLAAQKIQEKTGAPVSRSMLDFFISANEIGTGVMPVIRVAKPVMESRKHNKNDSPPQTTLQFDGAAIFDQDLKLKGFLGENQYWARLWVINRLRAYSFPLSTYSRRGSMVLQASNFKSRITPVVKRNSVDFKVRLEAQGMIIENNTPLDITNPETLRTVQKEYNRSIKKQVEHIVEIVQKEYKCDVFGFGSTVHRKYPYEWKRLSEDWRDLFPESHIELNVMVTISGTGISGKSLVPQKAGDKIYED